MLLASAFLASMGVCVKFASAYFHASELVFYRGIISLLMMGVYARFAGTSLHTPVPMMHFWRNVVGVFSLVAWFYALGKLPLATAMTLNYMSSVWIAAFLVGRYLARDWIVQKIAGNQKFKAIDLTEQKHTVLKDYAPRL